MSIKQIYEIPDGITVTSGLNVYVDFCSDMFNTSTTESNKATIVRTNGATFSYLSVYVSSNTFGIVSNVNFRKNSAAGNQSVSVTASTTGRFQDTSNTDVVATNDTVNLNIIVGADAGSAAFENISIVSSPTTNWRMFGFNSGNNIAAAAIYKSVSGFASTTTETLAQNKFRTAGTLKKAQAIISTNTAETNNTVGIRINAATKNISMSITALTTGSFEDTSNTDAVVSEDLVNWITTNTGNSTLASIFKVEFVADDSKINQVLMHLGGVAVGDGVTSYIDISGRGQGNATEANRQVSIDFNYTVSTLEVYISSNATTSNSTCDFRVGATTPAGSPSVSITSGTTGYFSDLSSTYNGASADLVDHRIVNGGGGSLTIVGSGMLMNETQAAAPPPAVITSRSKKKMLLGVGL